MQQHRVGALFGLFVRTIGAARFVCAIAPVAALVAAASIPLPRAASSIDVSAPSSGLVQLLAVARRAANGSQEVLQVAERRRHAPSYRESRTQDDDAKRSPASRIGERWLQARAEHRAVQRLGDPSPRAVGERLLHASSPAVLDPWSRPSALAAFALLGDVVKPVASTGGAPRAPPDGAAKGTDAGDPQPASSDEVAPVPPSAAQRDPVAAAPQSASGDDTAAPQEKILHDSVSPLKLSSEQRNISRFVARRYRVNLDDVQRFVAHAYHAAGEFRLDPHLVLAVMSIESSFNPNARSSAGAQGLMQVLTRVHLDKFAPYGGARAALDPVANISVGSRILKEYLVREGSVEGALKSYVGAALLPHDFGYGSKVLGERARIAAAARDGDALLAAPARAGATKIAMVAQQNAKAAARVAAPTRTADASSAAAAPVAQTAPVAPAASIAPAPATAKDGEAGARDGAVTGAKAGTPPTGSAPAEERRASVPGQASEPRASSNATLAPAGGSREL